MKLIAFVHAKGHSERVPNKNLRMLGGKPYLLTQLRMHWLRQSFVR